MNRLFRQLVNSVGIVTRTLRAFVSRQLMGFAARLRRLTSFSRHAAKLVPKAVKTVAVAGKKPTKRSDYVETKGLFISKSFIVIFVLALIALGVLFYLVLWPYLVSAFFTAHFYVGDQRTREYDGKVVLYYDQAKEKTLFKGSLDEGVMEGRGESFDEEGLAVYSGGYAQGLYDGQGKLYRQGVLIYQGAFAQGVCQGQGMEYDDSGLIYDGEFSGGHREGQGAQYVDGSLVYQGGFERGLYSGQGSRYQNAVLIYKGGFMEGLYDGQGSQYDGGGFLIYRGEFLQGAWSGQGTQYYPSGQIKYKGGFLGGKYDGGGALYNPQGSLAYTGGFSGGAYQGGGKLYLENDMALEGEFAAGEPVGEVALYKGGKLFYQGETEGLVPQGMGTLYAKTGEAVYSGAVARGGADAGSLLGLTADQAQEVFCGARLTRARGQKAGFSLTNSQLGVTLFLTLKSEDKDPVVHYVYQYPRDSDSFIDYLPFETAAQYEAWGDERGLTPLKTVPMYLTPVFTGDVPFEKQRYYRVTYYYEDHIFVAWSHEEGGALFMAEWIAPGDLPETQGTAQGEAEDGHGARLDALLGQLGLGDKTPQEGRQNPYYGQLAPNLIANAAGAKQPAVEALAQEGGSGQAPLGAAGENPMDEEGDDAQGEATEALEGACRILTAMVDYLEQAEARQVYGEQLEIVTKQLEKQALLTQMDMVGQQTLKDLQSQQNKLELQISRCIVGMDKAQLSVEDLTQDSLADYDLHRTLTLAVTPQSIDVGGIELACGGLSTEVKLALMDLELAYQQIEDAKEGYQAACGEAEGLQAQYLMGTAEQERLYGALLARGDGRVYLYGSLCAYVRLLADLNGLTKGYLAQSLGWYEEIMTY